MKASGLCDHDIVTRRFGVRQFSTEADGFRSCKVRPIDDFTESLVNLTNGSEESLIAHGIDFILAATAYRVKSLSDNSLSSDLCAKTTPNQQGQFVRRLSLCQSP